VRKFFIIILILIAIGSIALAVYKMKGVDKDQPNYRTVEVEKGYIAESVVATGYIYPLAKIEVRSKIGGIVNRFFVEEGDLVKEGQRLAEVIPGATPLEMVRVREEVRSAEIEQEKAQLNLQRSQELLKKGLISQKEFEEVKTTFYLSEARYYAARAELQVLEHGSPAKSKLSNTGGQETKEAEEAIKSMIITSPIAGIVLSRDTDEGTSVSPIASATGGTIIMTIADISEMQFKGDIDESEVEKVQLGMPVKIHVEAYPHRTFPGELSKIAPLGVEVENIVNFQAKIKILEGTELLMVGMSADAEIIIAESKNTLLINEGAVIREKDKAFIEIPDASTEERKKRIAVKLGLSNGIKTEVLEGLKEGDKVIMPS
jgi:HlyD family secretion protein